MHNPVMVKEVLETLSPQDAETYIDATFGAGGYTRAILQTAKCKVIAFDRDPDAEQRAEPLSSEFKNRFVFKKGRFGDMDQILSATQVEGVVFDIGVSSYQIDKPERGFSFKFEGPLDMRMEKSGLSAADVVNSFDEKEIARILWVYGEERRSRAIAKAICERRKIAPFTTTKHLADLVREIVSFERPGFDPATRTFQALRLYVNDELGELERGLKASEKLLKEGGRLVVVSFHSLEDRIVKDFLRARSGGLPQVSRHMPDVPKVRSTFTLKTKKALTPGEEEIRSNPRARSAKLRWAIRTREAA